MVHDVLIRGSRDGLMILLSEALDFATVLERLANKLSASGRFFAGARVTVVTGRRRLQDPERNDLATVLREHGGLILEQVREGEDPAELLGWAQTRESTVAAASQPSAASQPALEHSAPASRPAGPLVVNRTLRSGQSVHHPGDLIIIGDVNPGAEVIAGGHIVVLGALRGVAHAGATGDDMAIVAASRLEPTQLRIGSRVARPPDGARPAASVPEVARVAGGQIIIESRHGPAGL